MIHISNKERMNLLLLPKFQSFQNGPKLTVYIEFNSCPMIHIFASRESRREEFCTFKAIFSIEKSLLHTNSVSKMLILIRMINYFRAV